MCASCVSVGLQGTQIIRLSILSFTAHKRMQCDCVTIQLPEHQCKDVATHDDRKRRQCLNAILLSYNNFRIAQEDLHAITLTFREFFDEMTV